MTQASVTGPLVCVRPTQRGDGHMLPSRARLEDSRDLKATEPKFGVGPERAGTHAHHDGVAVCRQFQSMGHVHCLRSPPKACPAVIVASSHPTARSSVNRSLTAIGRETPWV